jgi:MFS transporter, PHS family, inorganic phosphate transporter
MWRIIIGFSCIPSVIAFFLRLTLPETPRFTMDIQRNIDKATADIESMLARPGGSEFELDLQENDNETGIEMLQVNPNPTRTEGRLGGHRAAEKHKAKPSWAEFGGYVWGQRRNLRMLVGTSYSWFALDVRCTCYTSIKPFTD